MGNPFLESENDENKDKPSWMRHMSVSSEERHPTITLAIISRRSQHRAGLFSYWSDLDILTICTSIPRDSIQTPRG